MLDFAKAFDMVRHKHLLTKLSHYVISGSLHNWIYQFVANRSQRVVVEGAFSDESWVESGVVQGTVLRPLLFLLFINNLLQHVSSQFRLFADDCLIYRPIHSTQDQIALQRDLLAMEAWGDTWGMRSNAKKCNIMRVSHSESP